MVPASLDGLRPFFRSVLTVLAAWLCPAVRLVLDNVGVLLVLTGCWDGLALGRCTEWHSSLEEEGKSCRICCLALIFRATSVKSHQIGWVVKTVYFHVRAAPLLSLSAARAHGWGHLKSWKMGCSSWEQYVLHLLSSRISVFGFPPATGSVPTLPKAQGMLSWLWHPLGCVSRLGCFLPGVWE